MFVRAMRYTHLKLQKGHSTKAERVIGEILKSSRAKFQAKVMIQGHEVDFLVGNTIIEANGHSQDEDRNNLFASLGYRILHFHNNEILNNKEIIINKLKEINDFKI